MGSCIQEAIIQYTRTTAAATLVKLTWCNYRTNILQPRHVARGSVQHTWAICPASILLTST